MLEAKNWWYLHGQWILEIAISTSLTFWNETLPNWFELTQWNLLRVRSVFQNIFSPFSQWSSYIASFKIMVFHTCFVVFFHTFLYFFYIIHDGRYFKSTIHIPIHMYTPLKISKYIECEIVNKCVIAFVFLGRKNMCLMSK